MTSTHTNICTSPTSLHLLGICINNDSIQNWTQTHTQNLDHLRHICYHLYFLLESRIAYSLGFHSHKYRKKESQLYMHLTVNGKWSLLVILELLSSYVLQNIIIRCAKNIRTINIGSLRFWWFSYLLQSNIPNQIHRFQIHLV